MRFSFLFAAITAALSPAVIPLHAVAASPVFLNETTLKNDVVGTLSGSVKFAQTHTIDAKDNSGQEMPRLTSTRDTLVMFIPQKPTGLAAVTLEAFDRNHKLLGRLTMNTPQRLPRADRPAGSALPDVVYSDKAWSQILPADWVQPGLTLTFSSGTGEPLSGTLSDIDIGGETQVVVQNIRIGMLTPPGPLANNPFEQSSQQMAEDYFQKIPVSELIVGNYAPVELKEVVLSNGVKYTSRSEDTGDGFNGDMRENIGKGLIAMGIDNANFGINDSGGATQWQPAFFHQVAVHQLWGLYRNGRVQHGWSGGNGMATLAETHGNEFSHELGHGYGMGHYPGGGKWSIHNQQSGWGWDSIKNRFIANFFWDRGGDAAAEEANDDHVTPPFLGTYQFNRDTMGGGVASSPLSRYTLHTGYSQKRIQQYLENEAVITPEGYLKWDESQRKMVEIIGDGRRIPTGFGVPVVTLVGFYDPQGKMESYIYPALHGSQGFTYAPLEVTPAQCQADVTLRDGNVMTYPLSGVRLEQGHMNRFHINVPASQHPESLRITCPQQDMDASYLTWKQQKLGVETFYNWDTNKNQAVGSIYYYPLFKRYFRLMSKPYGYFPLTPTDNAYWTYLTDENALRSEYESQLTANESGKAWLRAERSIDAASEAPRPPGRVGHLMPFENEQMIHDQNFVDAARLSIRSMEKADSVTFIATIHPAVVQGGTPGFSWTLPDNATGVLSTSSIQAFSIRKLALPQRLKVKVLVAAGKASRELEQEMVIPAAIGGSSGGLKGR